MLKTCSDTLPDPAAVFSTVHICFFHSPHWHCRSGALSHTMCVNEFLLKPFKSHAYLLMESDWIIFSTVSLGLISILNWTYGCVGVPMIPSFPIIGSIIQPPRPETDVATALDFMLGLDGETPIAGLVRSLRILGTWSGGGRRGKQCFKCLVGLEIVSSATRLLCFHGSHLAIQT